MEPVEIYASFEDLLKKQFPQLLKYKLRKGFDDVLTRIRDNFDDQADQFYLLQMVYNVRKDIGRGKWGEFADVISFKHGQRHGGLVLWKPIGYKKGEDREIWLSKNKVWNQEFISLVKFVVSMRVNAKKSWPEFAEILGYKERFNTGGLILWENSRYLTHIKEFIYSIRQRASKNWIRFNFVLGSESNSGKKMITGLRAWYTSEEIKENDKVLQMMTFIKGLQNTAHSDWYGFSTILGERNEDFSHFTHLLNWWEDPDLEILLIFIKDIQKNARSNWEDFSSIFGEHTDNRTFGLVEFKKNKNFENLLNYIVKISPYIKKNFKAFSYVIGGNIKSKSQEYIGLYLWRDVTPNVFVKVLNLIFELAKTKIVKHSWHSFARLIGWEKTWGDPKAISADKKYSHFERKGLILWKNSDRKIATRYASATFAISTPLDIACKVCILSSKYARIDWVGFSEVIGYLITTPDKSISRGLILWEGSPNLVSVNKIIYQQELTGLIKSNLSDFSYVIGYSYVMSSHVGPMTFVNRTTALGISSEEYNAKIGHRKIYDNYNEGKFFPIRTHKYARESFTIGLIHYKDVDFLNPLISFVITQMSIHKPENFIDYAEYLISDEAFGTIQKISELKSERSMTRSERQILKKIIEE